MSGLSFDAGQPKVMTCDCGREKSMFHCCDCYPKLCSCQQYSSAADCAKLKSSEKSKDN